MKVQAILQARMGSTRLPGKVLEPIAGLPMIAHCMRRLQRCRTLHGITVATTTAPGDDEIAAVCESERWMCFRGSEQDVLLRYVMAARAAGAEAVLRVTSDCPLLDARVIDDLVERFLHAQPTCQYASNTLAPRTYPRGLDAEVVRLDALELAQEEDRDAGSREHVTPYIWRRPSEFGAVRTSAPRDFSQLRWTVDTPEDLEFVRQVYAGLGRLDFSWEEVLQLLERRPELRQINSQVRQKEV